MITFASVFRRSWDSVLYRVIDFFSSASRTLLALSTRISRVTGGGTATPGLLLAREDRAVTWTFLTLRTFSPPPVRPDPEPTPTMVLFAATLI